MNLMRSFNFRYHTHVSESPIYHIYHLYHEGVRNDMNAESNRNHFDTIASQYDDRPGAAKVAKVIANAVMKEYDFDEESTVLMEYACGTGKSYTNCLLSSLM